MVTAMEIYVVAVAVVAVLVVAMEEQVEVVLGEPEGLAMHLVV